MFLVFSIMSLPLSCSSNCFMFALCTSSVICNAFNDTSLSTNSTGILGFLLSYSGMWTPCAMLYAFICWSTFDAVPFTIYSANPSIWLIVSLSILPDTILDFISCIVEFISSAILVSSFSNSFRSSTSNCAPSASNSNLVTEFLVLSSTSLYSSVAYIFTPFLMSAVCFSTTCLLCLNTMYISATPSLVVSCVTVLHRYCAIPVSINSFSTGIFAMCLLSFPAPMFCSLSDHVVTLSTIGLTFSSSSFILLAAYALNVSSCIESLTLVCCISASSLAIVVTISAIIWPPRTPLPLIIRHSPLTSLISIFSTILNGCFLPASSSMSLINGVLISKFLIALYTLSFVVAYA